MLKKTITYLNPFTEQQVTEDFYFHISKADLVEMEVEQHKATYNKDGEELTGMRAHLQRVVDAQDGPTVLKEFKDILRRSYGKKVGDRFIKTAQAWEEFEGSEPYSELLFQLLSNAEEAAAFIEGIVPHNLERDISAVADRANGRTPAELSPEERETIQTLQRENLPAGNTVRVLTQQEVADMDPDELKSGIATGRYKLS